MINTEAVRQGDAEIIENLLSEQMFDAAIEVHLTLGGSGLLEAYMKMLPLCLSASPSLR